MIDKKQNKPNIVFILSDDQGAWAMGCAGNEEIKTPNLDRLAATGMRFDNFFCASPVCSPARASILTGRIPSQHGVHDWIRSGSVSREYLPLDMQSDKQLKHEDKATSYLEGIPGYTDFLKDDGYVCGLSGKWHMGDSIVPQKGFTYWKTILRGGCDYYKADVVEDDRIFYKVGYITDHITDNALEFIEEVSEQEQPFYLSVHYTAPHSPWDRKSHPKTFFDIYEDCPCLSCPDEPVHEQQILSAPVGGTPEQRKENIKGYYASITAMDIQIGRIIDRLEDLGLRDNTLIVFTGDNGMNLGHHGIWGKGNGTFPQNLYDTSVKVPFIASMPGTIEKGIVSDALLSHYDIMPTLLDYVDTDYVQRDELPGKSFAGILKGDEDVDRGNIVVFDEYGPVRMIRSKDYKYIHRYPYGPDEFYDLTNDPEEKNNLIYEPTYTDKVRVMRHDMNQWFDCYTDTAIDGAKEGVTGVGQMGLAGLKGRGVEAYNKDIVFYHKK